jgi:hypothetical protein
MRLPRSIKAAAERLAREEGISMNQFVATAVAEKLAVMNAVVFFEERRQRADPKALRTLLARPGGTPPLPGDETRRVAGWRAAISAVSAWRGPPAPR